MTRKTINITITLPIELKEEMDKYTWVRWSDLLRACIQEFISNYPTTEELTKHEQS